MSRSKVSFLLGLSIFCTVQLQAQSDSGAVDLAPDHFKAGSNVTVSAPVAGDLLVAGQEVTLQNQVGGDLVVAGGTVRLDGATTENTYAAGGRVFVNGMMARNARIAGGTVEMATSSRIDGGASIAGGTVRMDGSIGKYLQVTAGSLYLNGPVGGDIEATGGQIELGPKARIEGNIRYRSSSELKRDPGAQVLGRIERLPASTAVSRGVDWALFALWTLGLMLLLVILLIVFPGFGSAIKTLERRPGVSALLGFALLVGIPVVSVILLVTFVGAPLGLFLLLTYGALLIVGYLAGGAVIGDLLLQRLRMVNADTARWRIVMAICGILILSVLGKIPFVGGLITLVALTIGAGAVGLELKQALRPVGQ